MNEEILLFMLKAYEEELKKRMPEKEYYAFSVKLAKEAFFREISNSPNEDFRNTVLDNFEAITGSEEDFRNLMNGIQDEDNGEGGDND